MNTPRRSKVLRVALLTLAIAAALVALLVACGPAAPGGQSGGGNDGTAATATPEATATDEVAPEPTDTPTAKPSDTPTTSPTATTNPANTPTPESTPTPLPTPFLMSDVTKTMLRLTEQAATAQAAGSTYNGPPLPNTIRVTVNLRPAHKNDLVQYLRDNGATDMRVEEFILGAKIPSLLLGPVTRHPAFRSGYTSGGIYPNMLPELDIPLTAYAAGELTATEAALEVSEFRDGRGDGQARLAQAYVARALVPGVHIVLDAAERGDAVRKYITANKGDVDVRILSDTEFYANVPVPALDGLYRLPGIVWLKLEPYYGIYLPELQSEPGSPPKTG